jgi:hypothetical protein
VSTFREEYDEWARRIIPEGASQVQRQEMTSSFYAGAFAMLGLTARIREDAPEEEGARCLEAWRSELVAYFEGLAKQPIGEPSLELARELGSAMDEGRPLDGFITTVRELARVVGVPYLCVAADPNEPHHGGATFAGRIASNASPAFAIHMADKAKEHLKPLAKLGNACKGPPS